MSSASPSPVLVSRKYATDGHLPGEGEIIAVRLSQDLFGPGSIIESSRNLPSHATRHNYHHAVVLGIGLKPLSPEALVFTVLPMPAYSFTDPDSGLSSTSWLLAQTDDFQQQHIPVPYEEAPVLTQTHPPFPTPARFGDPLQIGEWKNSRPSWVQALPQVTNLKNTTTFRCFEPPVKLSKNELRRLKEYCGHSPLPPKDDTVLGSSLLPRQPGGSNNHGGAGLPASRSLALQALYANDAVKQAFADFNRPSITLDSGSDDDDNWEDNMDPITFARYYAAGNPLLAKIVQEHDQKMRKRLNQGIMDWVEGIQSGHSEDGTS